MGGPQRHGTLLLPAMWGIWKEESGCGSIYGGGAVEEVTGLFVNTLCVYLLRVRGSKCSARDRRVVKVWNGW